MNWTIFPLMIYNEHYSYTGQVSDRKWSPITPNCTHLIIHDSQDCKSYALFTTRIRLSVHNFQWQNILLSNLGIFLFRPIFYKVTMSKQNRNKTYHIYLNFIKKYKRTRWPIHRHGSLQLSYINRRERMRYDSPKSIVKWT